MVDDRSGNVERLPGPLAGDRAAQWIRWIHEGSHSGPIWQFAVFLTGIFPLVFAVTGVIMWWRGRRTRKEVAGRTSTEASCKQLSKGIRAGTDKSRPAQFRAAEDPPRHATMLYCYMRRGARSGTV